MKWLTKKKKLRCIIWNYYLWLKNNIALFFMLKKVVYIYIYLSIYKTCFPLLNHYPRFSIVYHFIWRSSWNKKLKTPYISKICQIHTFHRILSKMTKFVRGKKIINRHGNDLTNIWTHVYPCTILHTHIPFTSTLFLIGNVVIYSRFSKSKGNHKMARTCSLMGFSKLIISIDILSTPHAY